MGIAPEAVVGPELRSHLEAGLAVAAGTADVALGLRPAARQLALDFVPVTWEPYELVLSAAVLPAAQPLVTALGSTQLRTAVTELGGYDLVDAGRIEALDPAGSAATDCVTG